MQAPGRSWMGATPGEPSADEDKMFNWLRNVQGKTPRGIGHVQVAVKVGIEAGAEAVQEGHGAHGGASSSGGKGLGQGCLESSEQNVEDGAGGCLRRSAVRASVPCPAGHEAIHGRVGGIFEKSRRGLVSSPGGSLRSSREDGMHPPLSSLPSWKSNIGSSGWHIDEVSAMRD